MKCFLVLNAFLLVLCFGIPSAAIAAEERLIAVILANSQQRYQEIHTSFVDNAATFCGEDCKIYVQKPNPDVMSLRNSVRKAVALDADLIVTYGLSATLAVKHESPPSPTLFADVYDPVQLGLISKKNSKGKNMTGIRGDAPVQALFKYFVEATKPQKLGVLYDPESPEGDLQRAVLEKACKMRHVEMLPLVVEGKGDFTSLLESLPEDTDGLFLANGDYADPHLSEILKFASGRKIPVITQRAGMKESGAFMVLETSDVEQGEQLAKMSDQLFKGENVSEIPMYRPRQVDFVINLKVAKKYGIQMPFQILSVATQVVR